MDLFVLILSVIFLFVTIAFIAFLNQKRQLEILLLLSKVIICTIVTGVYYLDTFSLSSDPELILLGLYFNGFYIIYLIIKNNREDTEEQINDPEDPTRPTPLSTDPTNSETDGGDIPII